MGATATAEEADDHRVDRARAVRWVGLAALTVNLALFALKGGAWSVTGSLAVGSEAINSLADSGYSLVVLVGLYLTTQPPDFEHPHGHERIEPFVSLFVAAGIFAAGGLILFRSGTSVLEGTYAVEGGLTAVAVLAVAAVAKYGLYRYCLRAGDRHNSPALVATALDNRNDILTAIAAMVGVLGARAGYPVLDPVAAAVVSVAILYTGVEIVRDNVNYLVGGAPPDELRAEIVRRAIAHPHVEGVHDVVAHYVGPEIDVSLHVEVEGELTLIEAHDIETEVMEEIRALPEIDDVFVHVDPKELDEWKDDDEVVWLAKQMGIDPTSARERDHVGGQGDGSDESDDGTPDPVTGESDAGADVDRPGESAGDPGS